MKKQTFRKRLVCWPVIASMIFGGLIPNVGVEAATQTYAAQVVASRVILGPGQIKQITLKFKNVGTETWIGSKTKTAVYLYGNSSILGHASWLKDDLPAIIAQPSVKPGQVASASFLITAPKTPGTYNERFLLSYGPNQWIKGSVVPISFVVQAASLMSVTPVISNVVTAPQTSNESSGEWSGVLVDSGGIEWQVESGGQVKAALAFKNTGTRTWIKDGKSYVSLYTGKGDRISAFKDPSWSNQFQAVLMTETSVKPGQIGHFTLILKAPEQTGSFHESFQLAAEDTAWIQGAVVTLPIRVIASREMIANGIGEDAVSSVGAQSSVYKATLLLKSTNNITLSGNGRLALTYGFKNTGSVAWGSMAVQFVSVEPALTGTLSSVRDESWLSTIEAARSNKTTAPGEIGFVGFTLKAPVKKGTYNAKFKLVADNQAVEDGIIEIPITVTADGYIEPEPTSGNQSVSSPGTTFNAQPLNGDLASLPDEPIIRVGLFVTTDDRMEVRAVSGGFKLTQNGSTVCSFNNGEIVAVSFDRANKVMKASGPRCTTQSSGYYVAVADDGLSPLELTDFSRPVSWLPGANDNKFRGKLELRYTPATDNVWIINELPIEWYLKGMAETSNSSPLEYQKALLTAARTYAMYHVQRGTKHADEYFTVDAKYDQVYRGYGAEARDGNVVAGIDATRGQIVTYDGKLAITPYYSRSDGRTRSWTEVWGGGPYGWLVSVPVPWDAGRTLWGHGVGLSATGALGMAADGYTYDQILKYFYTGIELRKAYK
ncbi:MAG: SpoIID/LytB domain-containing protein [Patescibacteria group bacterium]